MTKLGDLYSNFSRIDLDTRGGYARVADVNSQQEGTGSVHRAFKLLRHEIDYQKGMERFQDEYSLLAAVNGDSSAPAPITRICNSGFAPVDLSRALHDRVQPNLDMIIHPTGINDDEFLRRAQRMLETKGEKLVPYLVVELAPYDDSLLRQIHHQPKEDPAGLYRLPTGEVVSMAIQLLDVMDYLHKTYAKAYMDWKPEHIFWDGTSKQVKLIDWNVTIPIQENASERQNIRDDIRLFCGAVLYISLTFVDPDNPTKPIGPRPTEEPQNPVHEIRRRYWTDNPNFYKRGPKLDDRIKRIIRQGLDPSQGYQSPAELKAELISYAQQELGITETELTPCSAPESQYFKALAEWHIARRKLLQVQQNLFSFIEKNGTNAEFDWMFETIKQALVNFPGS
jgi:serine/threonine protein kinase